MKHGKTPRPPRIRSPQPVWLDGKKTPRKKQFLSGRRIQPEGITGGESVPELIEGTMLAYNAARLREACELFVTKMLRPRVTVGMSLSGALTPAGLGCCCIVPLIRAGFVDWIVATGANLYHDLHFALNCPLHAGSPRAPDELLRRNGVVRIYDILFGYEEVLLKTDEYVQGILTMPEFQKEMGSAEFHYHLGKYAALLEEENGLKDVSMLAAAYRAEVPVYTPSPGDSSIGMDLALCVLRENRARINPSIDVNETAAFVFDAKTSGGKSAVVLLGGGSPKNFVLQTEPYIQEILRLPETGHDYFLQVTDARPDTGGLSGATPREAVSWGKLDPARLPDAVVCYADTTLALPLLTHYALAKRRPRRLRRLYRHREKMLRSLTRTYHRRNRAEIRTIQSLIAENRARLRRAQAQRKRAAARRRRS